MSKINKNKLRHSRNALYIYGPMLVLIVIIILAIAFLDLSEKYNKLDGKGEDKVIGVKQFTLLKTFQQGENALYYIDYAAKYSAEQSVYDLAENGGYYTSPCGAGGSTDIANGADPYPLWAVYGKEDKPIKDCYPVKESAKSEFEKFFNYNINPYLSVYTNPSFFVSMPSEFSIESDENLKIIGTSKDDVLVKPFVNERIGGSWTGECGERIANIAEKEFNKKVFEQPDDSNCGDIISQYTENNCEAWCADFVSWVYKTANYPFKGDFACGSSWRICGADNVKNYFEKNELFIPKGSQDPIPGDAVFFRNSKCSGGVEHVGIVDSYKEGVLTTIEGNSGNRVNKNTYTNINSCIIFGFGRLKECSQTSAQQPAATPTSAATPVDSTTAIAPSEPATFTNVKVTHYYTPLEKEEGQYIYGYKTFEENVKMQGSGIMNDGKILRYTEQILDPNKGQTGTRGITAIGTNPTAKRTVAVDTSLIPLRSTVYIDFGPQFSDWNGCYLAEDVGGAITNKHIDLYVGVGEESLKESSKLPQYASIWVTKCTPMTKYDSGFSDTKYASEEDPSNLRYKITSSFKLNLDYAMFNKLSTYSNEAKLKLKAFIPCVKKNELKECEDGFTVVEVPDESVFLKFDRADDSFSPLYITKKPVTYKFALQVADIVPPPVVDGVAVDSIKKSIYSSFLKVKVKWSKNSAEDLHHYAVYCSESLPSALSETKSSAWVDKDKTETELSSCGGIEFQFGKKYYVVVTGVDKKLNELDKIVNEKNIVEISPVCCVSALSLLGIPEGNSVIANKDCGVSLQTDYKKCLI